MSTQKSDESRPEPVLFLQAAADAMAKYHKEHHQYPGEWYLLGFSFANGPYRVTDPEVWPIKEYGNRWRPKGCEFTYVIQSADKDHFLLQAINKDNVVEYVMKDGMELPKKVLLKPEDELCTIEQPRGKTLPEPVMFLNAAAAKFAEYRKANGVYANSWDNLDFHWALPPHRATDANVRPPRGCGKVWKPLGSQFSYEILRAEQNFFEIRSRNEKGLENYRITSRDVSPLPVP